MTISCFKLLENMDSFEKDVTDKLGDINLNEPVKEISVTNSLSIIS